MNPAQMKSLKTWAGLSVGIGGIWSLPSLHLGIEDMLATWFFVTLCVGVIGFMCYLFEEDFT